MFVFLRIFYIKERRESSISVSLLCVREIERKTCLNVRERGAGKFTFVFVPDSLLNILKSVYSRCN